MLIRPVLFLVVCLFAVNAALAQGGAAATGSPQAPATEPAQDAPGTHGTVLFSRGESTAEQSATQPAGELPTLSPGDTDPLQVTEAERSTETFASYGLELHLRPAEHAVAAVAQLAVRNDGAEPLKRVVLQVSSSLRWDEIAALAPNGRMEPLKWQARRVATDTDHTGWMAEVVATLPEPLASGATLRLRAGYSGTITASAERLERIGAPAGDAASADWDAIDAAGPDSPGTSVALRGFGDVLWYPVAAPPVFLGDGAKLVEAAGKMRLREKNAKISLRLVTEFAGDPPDAVFFCGRAAGFTVVHDQPDMPIAAGTGVATAEFPQAPLGFRVPSLFITDHPSTPAGTDSEPDLMAVVTEQFPALKLYSSAATQVEPLLRDWLGDRPLGPLHLLDHPGQPFEDDAVLVRPIAAEAPAAVAPSLVHSLTHAWIHSEQPWINEGLAQFMGLLWTERTKGRQAALDELGGTARTIALAEPAPATEAKPQEPAAQAATGSSSSADPTNTTNSADNTGQPLTAAWSDVFYRNKAAAVWWMLRDILGEAPLRQALAQYRSNPALDRDPHGMERVLERASHQDLRWFFDDWVYRDRGLPDLSLVNVTPRQIQTTEHRDGWLIAIEVRNDGDAVADVPVTVRSAPGASGASAASETQRLRIPAHSTVTRRIVFPIGPSEVQLNDGGVPETRVSVHTEEFGGAGG